MPPPTLNIGGDGNRSVGSGNNYHKDDSAVSNSPNDGIKIKFQMQTVFNPSALVSLAPDSVNFAFAPDD
jgi:hypothetical protein